MKTLHRSHANRLSPSLLSPYYHHGLDHVDDALAVDPSFPNALGGANVSSSGAQRSHRLSWTPDCEAALDGFNISGALLDQTYAATPSAHPVTADAYGVATSSGGTAGMSAPRTLDHHHYQHYHNNNNNNHHHHHQQYQLTPQYQGAAHPDQLLQEEQRRQQQHRLFLLQHRQQLQQQYLEQHHYLMQMQQQRQQQHFRSLSTPNIASSPLSSRIEMVVAAPGPAIASPGVQDHHAAHMSSAPLSSCSSSSSAAAASTITATTTGAATSTISAFAAAHDDNDCASISSGEDGYESDRSKNVPLARPDSIRQRSSHRSIVSGSIDELLGGSLLTPSLPVSAAESSTLHPSLSVNQPIPKDEQQGVDFSDPFLDPPMPDLADLQLQSPHAFKPSLSSPFDHSPSELSSPVDHQPVATASQALVQASKKSKLVSDAKVAKPRIKKANSSSQVIKLKDASHVIRREDDRGNVLGLFHVYKGFGPTPRKPSDPASRHAPRPKKVSCTRCRRLKKACHPSDEPGACCIGCQTSNPYLLKGPSIKDPIVDAVLFRLRPSKGSVLEFKRPSVYKLEEDLFATQDVHQIELTQGFSGSTFSVFVKRFHPAQGDLTFYPWKDAAGQTHRLDMPPYCITFISDTRKRLHEYLAREAYSYLQEQLDSNDMDPVLRDVFLMAQQTSGKCTLAKQALDLWCICRSIERLWRICGNDTLGVGPSQDPRSPYYGFVPVTPFMDQQLDQMIIQEMLKPLASQLLKNLQSAVNKEPKRRWFGIYTATAILLSNQERLMAHSRTMARRYSLPTKYSSFASCEAFLFAANILLSHFHFVCGGTAPLSIDWRSDDVSRTTTSIDDSQINHLERVGVQMRHKQQVLEGTWQQEEYDADLYWVRQMWLPGWKPVNTPTSMDGSRFEEMQA